MKNLTIKSYGESFIVSCKTEQELVDVINKCQRDWVEYHPTLIHESSGIHSLITIGAEQYLID